MKRSFDIKVERVGCEALREVRFEVLWPHLENSNEAKIDIDESKGALHLAAIIEGDIVGVVSVFDQKCDRYPHMFSGDNVARIRAMGVLEKMRGMNVGLALMREVEKLSTANVIWCDARKVSWGFYEKCGFLYASDVSGVEYKCYSVRDVGFHKTMYKRL
ncbi:MAG: hypothetical protein COA49_02445 [Bacteroidetes bacterium]|nr:MAG: hypothetical protein COA49_02445 [Bacteroidota bacterium]